MTHIKISGIHIPPLTLTNEISLGHSFLVGLTLTVQHPEHVQVR